MFKVVRGHYYEYKGWTGCIVGKEHLRAQIETKHNLKKYILFSPEGLRYESATLEDFCKEHGLARSNMCAVVNGKVYSYRGWTGYILGKEHLREVITKNKNKIKIPVHIKNIMKKFPKYEVIKFFTGKTSGIYTIKCPKNHEFDIQTQLIRVRDNRHEEICTECNPLKAFGYAQHTLFEFIKTVYTGTIIENDRKVLGNLELDIYLPELKLAFEYNGLHFHSELYKTKNYHLNKTIRCEKEGIRLIHIWEDSWLYNRVIMESLIKNILGKINEKVHARKCEIREVDFKDKRKFLNEHHLQGNCVSKINLGLYYNNELVSLMTFGKQRKNLGKESKDGEFELLRFCNKINLNVLGGASRLFKHFFENIKPNKIISFADRSWSMGKLYDVLGFKFIKNTYVGYHYIINGIRENRFKYRKNILVEQGFDINKSEHEIMLEREIYRIYDCGMMLFEYSF